MQNKLEKIPTTIGIIMDGNRRFAKEKGLPTLAGHRAGGEKLKEVVEWCRDSGVKNVIFFAFSTENWGRAEEEVSYLMNLIGEYLTKELDYFKKEKGVLHCVGEMSRFSSDLQNKLKKAEEETSGNNGLNIYLALNYGGRAEILSAIKSIIKENPRPEEVTEEYFSNHLYTKGMPDPDLIIRTSGEKRLSGFLPWQGVYSELFFINTYWPAFSKEEFENILVEYDSRERRLGK